MRQAQKQDVEPDQKIAFEGCQTDQLRNAMQEVLDTHTRSVQRNNNDNDDLAVAYSALNAHQQRIADKVVNAVCHQKKTLRFIVSGQGGTGKSRVIDYLNKISVNSCITLPYLFLLQHQLAWQLSASVELRFTDC